MAWRLGRVAVDGDSMTPTLFPGDWLLIAWRAQARVGDIVVVDRPDRPGLLVVKRAVRRDANRRWWVTGDNPDESDDSRVFGAVAADRVLGRAVFRYWPLRRAGMPG